MSVREYLNKIKTLYDTLESSGHRVSETEQVLNILNGLDDSFESVVAVISSKETTPSVQYVTSILLSFKIISEQNLRQITSAKLNSCKADKDMVEVEDSAELEDGEGIQTVDQSAKSVKK